jgi:hypothetical protein
MGPTKTVDVFPGAQPSAFLCPAAEAESMMTTASDSLPGLASAAAARRAKEPPREERSSRTALLPADTCSHASCCGAYPRNDDCRSRPRGRRRSRKSPRARGAVPSARRSSRSSGQRTPVVANAGHPGSAAVRAIGRPASFGSGPPWFRRRALLCAVSGARAAREPAAMSEPTAQARLPRGGGKSASLSRCPCRKQSRPARHDHCGPAGATGHYWITPHLQQ